MAVVDESMVTIFPAPQPPPRPDDRLIRRIAAPRVLDLVQLPKGAEPKPVLVYPGSGVTYDLNVIVVTAAVVSAPRSRAGHERRLVDGSEGGFGGQVEDVVSGIQL